MVTPAQTVANQANAQYPAGPNLRHGFASGRLIIPRKCKAEYDALETGLLKVHKPADISETLLVQEMAQSFCLKERALRLQSKAFAESDSAPKDLALLVRYQTPSTPPSTYLLSCRFKGRRTQLGSSRRGKLSKNKSPRSRAASAANPWIPPPSNRHPE